jgi:hypothetical protein
MGGLVVSFGKGDQKEDQRFGSRKNRVDPWIVLLTNSLPSITSRAPCFLPELTLMWLFKKADQTESDAKAGPEIKTDQEEPTKAGPELKRAEVNTDEQQPTKKKPR